MSGFAALKRPTTPSAPRVQAPVAQPNDAVPEGEQLTQLNTRIPKALKMSLRRYCLENEVEIQEVVALSLTMLLR